MTVRERRRRAEGDVTCIVGAPELRLPEEEAGSVGTTASRCRPWEGPLPFGTVVGEGETARAREERRDGGRGGER